MSSVLGGKKQRWSHNGKSYEGELGDSNVVPPEMCDSTGVLSLAGYYKIQGSRDANYFYWFFESRDSPSTDPFIIWLTGFETFVDHFWVVP